MKTIRDGMNLADINVLRDISIISVKQKPKNVKSDMYSVRYTDSEMDVLITGHVKVVRYKRKPDKEFWYVYQIRPKVNVKII